MKVPLRVLSGMAFLEFKYLFLIGGKRRVKPGNFALFKWPLPTQLGYFFLIKKYCIHIFNSKPIDSIQKFDNFIWIYENIH